MFLLWQLEQDKRLTYCCFALLLFFLCFLLLSFLSFKCRGISPKVGLSPPRLGKPQASKHPIKGCLPPGWPHPIKGWERPEGRARPRCCLAAQSCSSFLHFYYWTEADLPIQSWKSICYILPQQSSALQTLWCSAQHLQTHVQTYTFLHIWSRLLIWASPG